MKKIYFIQGKGWAAEDFLIRKWSMVVLDNRIVYSGSGNMARSDRCP